MRTPQENLNPEQKAELTVHVEAIAQILYEQTPRESLTSLEAIEKALRQHLLTSINPELARFFLEIQQEQRTDGSEKSKVI